MTRDTVPGVLGRILAIYLVLVTACYSPPQPDCGFSCGRNGECPDGYSCGTDFICRRDGAPSTLVCAVDARPDTPQPIDAPPPDADITAPTLFASMPTDGDTDVPVAATIRVQFSEAVMNVMVGTFSVSNGATMIGGTVTAIDPLTYIFTPAAPLPPSSLIVVELTNAITDLSGNPLATTSFSFTTEA